MCRLDEQLAKAIKAMIGRILNIFIFLRIIWLVLPEKLQKSYQKSGF
jgi:hypothetical protein